jgi:hypothetical protein
VLVFGEAIAEFVLQALCYGIACFALQVLTLGWVR